MQKAVFWIENLKVTQGMFSSFSHKGVAAIDIGACANWLKAPFDCTVKKIYPSDHEVWIQSNKPVKFADGTVDYMTVLTMHDENIKDLYVGKKIKQGEIYYHPGNYGYSAGTHIHITVGKGKFSGSGWYKNSYGQWCITNQYEIHKALYLHSSVKVTNTGGYNWIKTSTLNYSEEDEPMTDAEKTWVKNLEKKNAALEKKVAELEKKDKVYHYWTEIKKLGDWAYNPLWALHKAGYFAGESASDLNINHTLLRAYVSIAAILKAKGEIKY